MGYIAAMCCNIVTSADELGTDVPVDSNDDEQDSRLETSRNVMTACSLRMDCLRIDCLLTTQSVYDVFK